MPLMPLVLGSLGLKLDDTDECAPARKYSTMIESENNIRVETDETAVVVAAVVERRPSVLHRAMAAMAAATTTMTPVASERNSTVNVTFCYYY
jgi:hypothetical protein